MAEFDTFKPDIDATGPVARKSAAGENFPVASRLLPKELRPHVRAFYAFVRLADDIADDPNLESETKLGHLDALEQTLITGSATEPYLTPAVVLKARLAAVGVCDHHARQVLRAFRRDAAGARYATWRELMFYCRNSAAPVGRFLLDLHGEGRGPIPASDALCAALQVLNHIQDCREDWVKLGRCYLPQAWFDDAKISVERLVERSTDDALRGVFDRTLDQVDDLLVRAAPLPRLIRHRSLRLEAAVILSLAKALSVYLRTEDPLSRHVRLPRRLRLLAGARGLVRGLARR